jgi:hypothetical protein
MPTLSLSQAGQDVFPRHLVRRPGTYLDIGSFRPTYHNNTYALEKEGWTGLSIDCQEFSLEFATKRKNLFYCTDVTTVNWDDVIQRCPFMQHTIDYISFDVDEATMPAVAHFPWDKIRFATMTIEHDQYRFGTATRDYIREVLTNHGYSLICADVVMPNSPTETYGAFEDWYADLNFVDTAAAEQIRCDGLTYLEIFKKIDPDPYAFYCPPPSYE